MQNGTLTLPLDALALGFTEPDPLPNDDTLSVFELLRTALDTDDAMSDDPALGLLLGLRRELLILNAAHRNLMEREICSALHSAWLKLGGAVNLHGRQIEVLRTALKALQEGARGKHPAVTLPLDALALGFVRPETLPNDDTLSVFEVLRSALDADDAMSDDPALGLLLGVRRDLFILNAAQPSMMDDDDVYMALHSASLKLGAAVALHKRQIGALRTALKALQEGAREAA
jgi:hypothetical protein